MSYSVQRDLSGWGIVGDIVGGAVNVVKEAGSAVVDTASDVVSEAGHAVQSVAETTIGAAQQAASGTWEVAKAAGKGAAWVAGKTIGVASPIVGLVTGPVGILIPDAIENAVSRGVAKFSDSLTRGDIVGAASAVADTAWQTAKASSPYIQAGISFVPGVGPEAAAALALGMTIAQGGSISDALIVAARASIPGGPLAQGAFDMGTRIAKGQNVTDAAFNAAMNQPPFAGNPAALAAARAGYSITKGQNVQKAVTKEGTRLLMEAGIGPVKSAAEPITKALATGNTIPTAAVDAARNRLTPRQREYFDEARSLARKGGAFGSLMDGIRAATAAATPVTQPSAPATKPASSAMKTLIVKATLTQDRGVLDAVKLGTAVGLSESAASVTKTGVSLTSIPATKFAAKKPGSSTAVVVGGVLIVGVGALFWMGRKKRR